MIFFGEDVQGVGIEHQGSPGRPFGKQLHEGFGCDGVGADARADSDGGVAVEVGRDGGEEGG